MDHKTESRFNLVNIIQVLLILLFPAVMIPLGFYDQEWTFYLHDNQHALFYKLMKRSVFHSGKIGASDPAIILQLVILVSYFAYSIKRRQKAFHTFRPFLGFFVFCGLFTGLGLVHSIKWVVGRARPNLIFNEGKFFFTEWYEFGPQFVTDGVFYGSFPSGHTATIFLLITIAYWFIGHPFGTFKSKMFGWFWGVSIMVYSSGMIIGRSMSFDHWLTDSVGIVLLSWIFIHLIYYRILKIPAQVRYVAAKGQYAPLPRYWELSLLWRLFFITLGVMSVLIAARGLMIGRDSWLVLVAIPGAVIAYFLLKSVFQQYNKFMTHFQPYQN